MKKLLSSCLYVGVDGSCMTPWLRSQAMLRGWPGVKTMERKSQFPMTVMGKNLGRNALILKRFSGVLVMVLSGFGAGDSEVSVRGCWRRCGVCRGGWDVTE
ncbi:hypothetical protein AA957_02700 [Pseudomonas trivialis]|uniref:Uncharacterized protein n=1 Tax=Pseudomonas trivialis TaxID=200450 RepID=A0A0H5A2P4_9PSED|nr:hypothetical protein AA957_02700 [Pseudomonas trivialis]